MSASTEPAWLAVLREAARKAGPMGREVEVLQGAAPGLFDAHLARVASSCLMGAFVVAAAIFREKVSPLPFDLIALLLRTASVAFIVRAGLALLAFGRKLARNARARTATLAWSPDGLWLECDGTQHWVAREEVLAIALREQPEQRATPASEEPLCLVLRPGSDLRLLEIPPFFARSQAILAARLQRWLARELGAPADRFDAPRGNPEERYSRIARGELEAGEVRIPEGFGYRLRAPYGALLGCVFAADALRAAGPLAPQLLPGVIAACMLALIFLAGWLLWMQRRRKARLGIAMALTREELLLRGSAGTVSVPWGQLAQIEVTPKLVWSPFFGSYPIRILSLGTTDGERIVFDGGFLGVPAEAVLLLCEAYRRRWI